MHRVGIESAATRARDIYLSIKGNGWEGTLQKYRPALASPQKRQNATVGEFLNEVKAKADGDPKHLRITPRPFEKSFQMFLGSAQEMINSTTRPEGIRTGWEACTRIKFRALTPDKVQAWKRAFLSREGNEFSFEGRKSRLTPFSAALSPCLLPVSSAI